MTSPTPPAVGHAAVAAAEAVIAAKSRSFAFAARLLPAALRADAIVLYAWCRRADDAVDDAPDRASAARALAGLRDELDAIYRQEPSVDPQVAAFADVIYRTAMPQAYPAELLAGMAMDLDDTRYDGAATLHRYCYRAAGVVGLMMCHVLGTTHRPALRAACELGMAMQITNICRDVAEDWRRGRLYLPATLLADHGMGDLPRWLGQPLPAAAGRQLAPVVRALLVEADVRYRRGLQGLRYLPWRAAVAIGVAAAVYSDIGVALGRQGFDPLRGRAYTSTARKLWLTLRVVAGQVAALPGRWWRRPAPALEGGPVAMEELLAS